ncbi:hypothetical protein UB46_31060 [Burkholderiaceae bacterium 16]|nr:hypothetical protein UB46_31060 [Burkholderiaceae bacterium 16]
MGDFDLVELTRKNIARMTEAGDTGWEPVIELHITNIHAREETHRHSIISRAATGVICGLGVAGYTLALRAMAEALRS